MYRPIPVGPDCCFLVVSFCFGAGLYHLYTKPNKLHGAEETMVPIFPRRLYFLFPWRAVASVDVLNYRAASEYHFRHIICVAVGLSLQK